MEQYIYLLQPRRLAMLTEGPTDEEAQALAGHVAYLERLSGEGDVLLAGRTQTADENTRGLVILQAPSESAATAIMQGDPAVAEGVMSAELYPYRIAALSPQILEATCT